MGLISRVSSRTYRKHPRRESSIMKINIANPGTGQQKTFEIDDEHKVRHFYDKRISHEVSADPLGDEFKGYVLRITGGEDKQGFSMKQGVLCRHRVRLLMKKGASGYTCKRNGERKRKAVRGCIVNHDLAVISTCIVRKGDNDIAGVTDAVVDRRLGPKRANNVRNFVIRRELKADEKHAKSRSKAPKIQRLITPVRLQRKRSQKAAARSREEASKEAEAAYRKLQATRSKLLRAKKDSERSRRKSEGSSI